jgi:hypothetical protein
MTICMFEKKACELQSVLLPGPLRSSSHPFASARGGAKANLAGVISEEK